LRESCPNLFFAHKKPKHGLRKPAKQKKKRSKNKQENMKSINFFVTVLLWTIQRSCALVENDESGLVNGTALAIGITPTTENDIHRIEDGTRRTTEAAIQDSTDMTNNRNLQTCDTCNYTLYRAECGPGYEKDADLHGTYQFPDDTGICYEDSCCTWLGGDQCCVKSTGSNPGPAPPSCDVCTSIVWNVTYCSYGRKESMFGTYQYDSSDYYTNGTCWTDSCCASSLYDCCNDKGSSWNRWDSSSSSTMNNQLFKVGIVALGIVNYVLSTIV
jgi:hypothetical protein